MESHTLIPRPRIQKTGWTDLGATFSRQSAPQRGHLAAQQEEGGTNKAFFSGPKQKERGEGEKRHSTAEVWAGRGGGWLSGRLREGGGGGAAHREGLPACSEPGPLGHHPPAETQAHDSAHGPARGPAHSHPHFRWPRDEAVQQRVGQAGFVQPRTPAAVRAGRQEE